MEFENTINCKASIKKQKVYSFSYIDEETLKKGREYKYETPLYIKKGTQTYALYGDNKGLLNIISFHTYDVFTEKQNNRSI